MELPACEIAVNDFKSALREANRTITAGEEVTLNLQAQVRQKTDEAREVREALDAEKKAAKIQSQRARGRGRKEGAVVAAVVAILIFSIR